MGPTLGRDFAIESMSIVARMPGGGPIIDLLGHMRPDPRLRTEILGRELTSPLGLGPGLDVYARALPAWRRFGFGLMEVGPVSAVPRQSRVACKRDDARRVICLHSPTPGPSVTPLVKQLDRDGPSDVPLLFRIGAMPSESVAAASNDARSIIDALRPHAWAYSLATLRAAATGKWSDEDWVQHVGLIARAAAPQSLLLVLPADRTYDELAPRIDSAVEIGIKGFVIDGAVAVEEGLELGRPASVTALDLVHHLRRAHPALPIIAAGGIQSPRDALAFLDAGADILQIDDGLVLSGPGLAKRTNEAILARRCATEPQSSSLRLVDSAWAWSLLLGVALLLGTAMAVGIALTRVVLPYDEMLTGLTRERIVAINPQLLDFMVHDRISLAGTMFAVGIAYSFASWLEMRRGSHAAYVAVMTSAFSGFATFFAFLGFGYFDPFHAFVTTVLFQFQLMALRGRLTPAVPGRVADWDDDAAWRRSQWGQLIAVLHGLTLIAAGFVILAIACSFVLVETDLDFLCTTREALNAADPRLIPLIAHDRAAMGGMLLAAGIMLTLTALWGFGRGHASAWWMLLVGFAPGYLSAILVHVVVGYDDFLHLLPVSLGLLGTTATLILSGPYLLATAPSQSAVSAALTPAK
jgi:hypothetical protein